MRRGLAVAVLGSTLLVPVPFAAVGVANAAPPPTSPAELPRVFLDTHYVRATGASIAVGSGDDLQAALDAAHGGDELVLKAGATFVGNFMLPDKTGKKPVIVRSSALATLPAQGVRVSPANAAKMPKILSPNTFGAINTADGAHDYRFVGIEFGVIAGVTENTGVVRLSDANERSLDQLSRRIVIDRSYVHGNPTENDRRGVVLNGIAQAVVDSYVSEFHEVGIDSQAIAGWGGPGPFKITNNYVEGAAENLLFGGADPLVPGVVASDIEIRHNTFFKPLTWRKEDPSYAGIHWSVKNLLELKMGRRVLISGNVFRHSWGDGQTGIAINLKTATSRRAPWVQTTDVTFTNNLVDGAATAMTIEGRDPNTALATKRVAVVNNLFTDIDGKKWKGGGYFLLIIAGSRPPGGGAADAVDDVFVDHNTVFQSDSIISAEGPPSARFVFINNITPHNRYGVKGDGAATGTDTLDKFFPRARFQKNVLVGGKAVLYPPDNFFPASMNDVRFVDLAGGNFRLAHASPYRHAALDGTDIGADIDAIAAATGAPV
jgi:hypothetical protein